MTSQMTINIGDIKVSNQLPFTLFGGMNVLESRELALEIASYYKEITDKLGIPYVFKASFDKANRSSISSFRGPDWKKDWKYWLKLKTLFKCRYSDIHESSRQNLLRSYRCTSIACIPL